MGLRPIKGDENLAEVKLSRISFDALSAGRVADRVNGRSEAFDRAGGLSSPPFRILGGAPIRTLLRMDTNTRVCNFRVAGSVTCIMQEGIFSSFVSSGI
jgi:hypothetical protein